MSLLAPRLESLPAPTGTGETLRIDEYGIGVDCHSRFYQVTLLVRDEDGDDPLKTLRYEFTVPADIPSLVAAKEQLLDTLRAHNLAVAPGALRYTCESSGPYHKPLLNAWGAKPSVVNPLLAGATRRKTDVLDARLLAYQGMTGLWPATYVMPHEYEQVRHWVRAAQHWQATGRKARQKIVALTTMYGHTVAALGSVVRPDVRGIIEDLARGTAKEHPALHPKGVPTAIGTLIEEWYAVIDDAAMREADAWKQARALQRAQQYLIPSTGELIGGERLLKLIQTIPGMGPKASLVTVAETGDISRFPSARAYVAFCGLDPSLKVSAGKVTSHQRRRGNAQIAMVVKQAVTPLLTRHSEPLGRWGYVLSKRHHKGGFRKAATAVGRRVLVATYHVWRRGEEFSYDGYELDLYSQIRDDPVGASALSPRVKKVLRQAGFFGAAHVARDLATVYGLGGIGPKAREEIDTWLSHCKAESLAARAGNSTPDAAT